MMTAIDRRQARKNDEAAKAIKNLPALRNRFVPQFFMSANQRLPVIKEIKRRLEQLRADAGVDSIQKEWIAQNAVFLQTYIETKQREALDTGVLDAGSIIQAMNGLIGCLAKLGFQKSRKAVVDLREYLDRKSREIPVGDDDDAEDDA